MNQLDSTCYTTVFSVETTQWQSPVCRLQEMIQRQEICSECSPIFMNSRNLIIWMASRNSRILEIFMVLERDYVERKNCFCWKNLCFIEKSYTYWSILLCISMITAGRKLSSVFKSIGFHILIRIFLHLMKDIYDDYISTNSTATWINIVVLMKWKREKLWVIG